LCSHSLLLRLNLLVISVLFSVSLLFSSFLSSTVRRSPCFTLFPYTTLFRSRRHLRPRHRFQLVLLCQRHGRGATRSRAGGETGRDRKSTRLNSSHGSISYAVFCLKKKKKRVGVTIGHV